MPIDAVLGVVAASVGSTNVWSGGARNYRDIYRHQHYHGNLQQHVRNRACDGDAGDARNVLCETLDVPISFPPTSNRATWIFTGQIMDASDNSLLDLTGLTFVFEIRDQSGCARLQASTANGKFTIISTGLFRWEFTESDMRTLGYGTYDTGLTMANADQTVQLSVGPLPIVDGIVP
jgi:hypothetical protein